MTFVAPGAGQWDLDRSHYDGGMTPIVSELMGEATPQAYRKLFKLLGVPADTVDTAIINGFFYSRIRPLVGADRVSPKAPPAAAIRLVGRIHPELRRRAVAAQKTIDEPPWQAMVDTWRSEIKPKLVEKNLAFQRVELSSLSQGELADHLSELLEYLRFTFEEHHRLHGYDLGPIGRLVVFGHDRGVETKDMLATMVGASPSTVEPRIAANEIRAEVEATGGSFATLEDIRAASTRAAELADHYIERHGHLLFSSYDLDSPTLVERPDILIASIRDARPPVDVVSGAEAAAAEIRERLPMDDRKRFDVLLGEARAAMDMRDDNGPVTVEWPSGLLRLAMMEAGRRLVESGELSTAEHVFELNSSELPRLVRDGKGPSALALAVRAEVRAEQKLLDPPIVLGDPEPPPPLDALPPASAELIRVVGAVAEEILTSAEPVEADEELQGVGIGSATFRGVARTATTAEEAFAAMGGGEILVTRNTSPAYNVVLSIAGGLVTETGGAMCHAAVLSRELGLPAVIGAAGCLDAIASGDEIEIDPVAGTVKVLS